MEELTNKNTIVNADLKTAVFPTVTAKITALPAGVKDENGIVGETVLLTGYHTERDSLECNHKGEYYELIAGTELIINPAAEAEKPAETEPVKDEAKVQGTNPEETADKANAPYPQNLKEGDGLLCEVPNNHLSIGDAVTLANVDKDGNLVINTAAGATFTAPPQWFKKAE